MHTPGLGSIVQGARQGGIQQLSHGLAAAQGQGHPAQAQEDFAGGDHGVDRLTPARQHQERTIGLVCAVEIARFLGHLGQCKLDLNVVEQDRSSLFQVLQGQLGVLLGARHLRNLMMEGGPLARLTAAVLLEHPLQDRARISQTTRSAQAFGQGEAQAAISRRNSQRPFQHRHCPLRAVQMLLADRQGFARTGHHRLGVDQLGATVGESPRQGLPALGIPVQLGEQHPKLVGSRVLHQCALQRGQGAMALASRDVGPGQLGRGLAPLGRIAQRHALLKPLGRKQGLA